MIVLFPSNVQPVPYLLRDVCTGIRAVCRGNITAAKSSGQLVLRYTSSID